MSIQRLEIKNRPSQLLERRQEVVQSRDIEITGGGGGDDMNLQHSHELVVNGILIDFDDYPFILSSNTKVQAGGNMDFLCFIKDPDTSPFISPNLHITHFDATSNKAAVTAIVNAYLEHHPERRVHFDGYKVIYPE